MLIYEVNLSVSAEIGPEYEEFLRHHIPEVIRWGGFSKADWWQRTATDEGAENPEGRTLWTIHYHVATREVLESYLRNRAPALRAEAVAKFGSRFTASRRILSAHEK